MTRPGVATVTRTSCGGQVMTVARYGYSAGHVSPSQRPGHLYIRSPKASFTREDIRGTLAPHCDQQLKREGAREKRSFFLLQFRLCLVLVIRL